MKFAINGNVNDIREITVRTWNDQSFWSPDFFGDLEVCFPCDHDRLPGSDAYICTEDEYKDLVDFWREEIRAMNAREVGDLGDYTDPEANADEVIMFAD